MAPVLFEEGELVIKSFCIDQCTSTAFTRFFRSQREEKKTDFPRLCLFFLPVTCQETKHIVFLYKTDECQYIKACTSLPPLCYHIIIIKNAEGKSPLKDHRNENQYFQRVRRGSCYPFQPRRQYRFLRPS